MENPNYTHVQMLLPEIEAMMAERKTQREVAEYFGFKDKYVVKRLLNRQREKRRKLEAGIVPRPKGGRGKMPHQEMWPRSRRMRLRVYGWKTSCCGIFCSSQKGSEAEGKISESSKQNASTDTSQLPSRKPTK